MQICNVLVAVAVVVAKAPYFLNRTAAILVHSTNPLGIEFYYHANVFLFFRFARACKLVAHNLIEGFDWLSCRKKVCFVQGQGQKYGQNMKQRNLSSFITISMHEL